ncbi:MAG: hypothetical protein ACJAZO_003033 [Myxococcota bacterium]|jgi:hypothetical protein
MPVPGFSEASRRSTRTAELRTPGQPFESQDEGHLRERVHI